MPSLSPRLQKQETRPGERSGSNAFVFVGVSQNPCKEHQDNEDTTSPD